RSVDIPVSTPQVFFGRGTFPARHSSRWKLSRRTEFALAAVHKDARRRKEPLLHRSACHRTNTFFLLPSVRDRTVGPAPLAMPLAHAATGPIARDWRASASVA